MSTDLPQLIATALSLPDDDRADLAFQLLNSLKPTGLLTEREPFLASEIEQRIASYEAGETEAFDLGEVDARIRQALDSRKSS